MSSVLCSMATYLSKDSEIIKIHQCMKIIVFIRQKAQMSKHSFIIFHIQFLGSEDDIAFPGNQEGLSDI